MSQEVSLLFRLNVCVTNFGYFLLSYKLLFKLIDISAGTLSMPRRLEEEFTSRWVLKINIPFFPPADYAVENESCLCPFNSRLISNDI